MIQILSFLSMFIDHLGVVLFPDVDFLRLVGRLAFPLFAYSVGVGAVKTHDIDAYLYRVFGLAVVSQFVVFFILGEKLNVCFVLFGGLLFFRLFLNSEYYMMILCCIVFYILPADYGFFGFCFVVSCCFAVYINQPIHFVVWFLICLLQSHFLVGMFFVGIIGLAVAWFVPFRRFNISKVFSYSFYPLHLIFLYVIGFTRDLFLN